MELVDISNFTVSELKSFRDDRMAKYRASKGQCKICSPESKYASYGKLYMCYHDSFSFVFPEFLPFWKDDKDPRRMFPGSNKTINFQCRLCSTIGICVVKKFLTNVGCEKCRAKQMMLPIEEAKRRFAERWGDTYEYRWETYTKSSALMKMICKIHGEFEKKPHHHIDGHGCIKCIYDGPVYFSGALSTPEILDKRCREVWKDIYDYDFKTYTGCDNPFTVICKSHGPFQMRLDSLLKGRGCPVCRSFCKDSAGIARLKKYMYLTSLSYREEVNFGDLRGEHATPRPLMYDMVLEINQTLLIIEFDGAQHFRAVSCWGGKDKLIASLRNDYLKDIYAIDKGHSIIRIPYWIKDRDFVVILSKCIRLVKQGQLIYLSYPHLTCQVKSSKHQRYDWIMNESALRHLKEAFAE